MEKERNYVVPHDFSEAADNALKQAVEIAKPTSSKVYILHIKTRVARKHHLENFIVVVPKNHMYKIIYINQT